MRSALGDRSLRCLRCLRRLQWVATQLPCVPHGSLRCRGWSVFLERKVDDAYLELAFEQQKVVLGRLKALNCVRKS